MRLFVDANIIVATLNKEYPLFTWSSRLLSLQGKHNIELFTSPLCLAIAFYFASKKSNEKIAKEKIGLLLQHLGITSMDGQTTDKAINNKKIHDFEDGMEYYSAIQQKCNYIITENQKDFYFSEIGVVGCEEFLLKLYSNK
jgi:predicted nucleic acid-binding protein